MTATNCSFCHGPLDGTVGASGLLLVNVWDAAAIQELLSRDDTDRCTSCGNDLGSAATVALFERSPLEDPTTGVNAVDVRLGTGAQRESVAAVVADRLETPIQRIAVCDDITLLRRTLMERVKRRIWVMNDYSTARLDGNEMPWLVKNWHRFEAPAFFVAAAVPTGRIPDSGVVLSSSDPAATLDFNGYLETLLHLQRQLLLAVWHGLLNQLDQPLETAITRLVQPGVFQTGAADGIRTLIDNKDVSPVGKYLAHALNAFVCLAAGSTNALADTWTDFYCRFELERSETLDEFSYEHLALTPERVGPTLTYSGVWDALARITVARNRPDFGPLENTLERAGEGVAYADFLRHGIEVQLPDDVDIASLVERIPFHNADDPAEFYAEFAARLMLSAARNGQLDLCERILGGFADKAAGRPETVALLEVRFGEACKLAHHPNRFLDRVGYLPRPSERSLSARMRFGLGIERSNAQRLRGEAKHAREILETLWPLSEGNNEWRTLLARNIAILSRTTGQPDRSLTTLLEILPAAQGGFRLEILESLIASYERLGMGHAARQAAIEALSLARGPWASRAAPLEIRVAITEPDADATSIRQVLQKVGLPKDPIALVAVVGGWAQVAQMDPAAVMQEIDDVIAAVVAAVADLSHREELSIPFALCRNAALLLEEVDHERAGQFWQKEYDLREAAHAPDSAPMIALARLAVAEGDLGSAERLLARTPAAESMQLGEIENADAALNAGGTATKLLATLGQELLSSFGWDDPPFDVWRLLAEVQRDTAGRAKLLRELDEADLAPGSLRNGLGSVALSVLATERNSLHVIEWADLGDSLVGFRTRINSRGEVSANWLFALPLGDASPALALRLRARLDGWRTGRPGDPLDWAPWHDITAWLTTAVQDAQPGDHIVVIDHSETTGLPWHAAPMPGCTVSYSPSWSSLLLAREPAGPQLNSVGIIVVPAAEDDARIIAAFGETVSRIRELGAGYGWRVDVLEGAAADDSSVLGLLESVDVAVMLCHGFQSPASHEVALLLAHDGALPTRHAIAAMSPAGRRHLWSWRDAGKVREPPRLLISAACSSGSSHIAGAGERLGFYGALRVRGTKAIVAPMWDAVPRDSCAIIVGVLERHLGQRIPLAESVANAAADLRESGTPLWRSDCFGVEGDWR
jgi:hypothetical protein